MGEKPKLKTCKAIEFTHDSTVVKYADAVEYAEAMVAAERARLLPLLDHAVAEADGWHDEARGGMIADDPIMLEARREVIRAFGRGELPMGTRQHRGGA